MHDVSVKECRKEIIEELSDRFFVDINPADFLKSFTFYEFTLEELGLPNYQELLSAVKEIESKVGLVGWRRSDGESKFYKGFSLTYNPEYTDLDTSIYHQTWGSPLLKQNFGRNVDLGFHTNTKNNYYDTYGFRSRPPLIEQYLGKFLDRFRFSVLRSRIAYHFMHGVTPKNDTGWHVDEFPYQLLRINIPLQTSHEYILDIEGRDEFGNSLSIKNKHLETGKVYLWNTRIPHRVAIKEKCQTKQPRIHMVLGVSPYFIYDTIKDSYSKSTFFGHSIDNLVRNRLFVKNCEGEEN